MSYQVAAIRLLAASKGDNGGAKKAFRAERIFFEKSLKSAEIRGLYARASYRSHLEAAAKRKKIAADRQGNCRINQMITMQGHF